MNRLYIMLLAMSSWAVGALLPDLPRSPEIVQFSEHPFVKRGHAKVISGGEGPKELFFGMVRSIARALRTGMNYPLQLGGWSNSFLLVAGDTLPDPMKQKRLDLSKILGELETFEKRQAEEPDKITQTDAEAADTKVEEAKALQDEIESFDNRRKARQKVLEKGRLPTESIVPDDNQPGNETKDEKSMFGRRKNGERVAGYMRLGDYVVASKGMQEYQRAGRPKSVFALTETGSLLQVKGERQPLVPMTKSELEAIMESKAVPTIGTDPVVIEPTLVPEIVRVTEHDRLQLRDVLNISQTGSDAVKYTRLVSYTRAAATVANSAQKPESAMSLDAVTEAVRTIAVWMPVEEQQLADYPQLSGLINNELLYDVDKHVEELVVWGDGAGENFLGICNDPDVLACRTEGGDTLIDIARRGITDVRRAGYEPNGIVVDPLDWEDIVLEKGSDNRYVWVVVTEGATQRLWAVPVIETVAMEDFQGNATEERRLIVGDFRRGATLWDRQRSTISVGFINDQFIRNQRTILAELRAAFGVLRPGAFRTHTTQEALTS